MFDLYLHNNSWNSLTWPPSWRRLLSAMLVPVQMWTNFPQRKNVVECRDGSLRCSWNYPLKVKLFARESDVLYRNGLSLHKISHLGWGPVWRALNSCIHFWRHLKTENRLINQRLFYCFIWKKNQMGRMIVTTCFPSSVRLQSSNKDTRESEWERERYYIRKMV